MTKPRDENRQFEIIMLKEITQFLSLVCLFMVVSEMPCAAQGAQQLPVEYSGIINKSIIGTDGKPGGTPSVYSFHAEVASDRYRITLVAIHDFSCFEQVAGSDGLDCYFQQKMWPSWADMAKNADFQESAQVTPGSYPTLAEPPIQLLWMLLASHKSLTNDQSIALTRIKYAPYDKLKAKIEYSESCSWPHKIEMFSPGIVLLQGKEYPILHPYENGYKLWDLDVIGTSETNGLTFPRNAIFSQFATYMSDSGKMDMRKFWEITILVTNISVSSLSSNGYLPVLSHKKLSAVDYRFSPKMVRPDQAAVDVIQYQLPDGEWLDRSNSHVSYVGMSLKMETSQTIKKVSNVQRSIIFGLFAVSTIIFFSFMLKRKRS